MTVSEAGCSADATADITNFGNAAFDNDCASGCPILTVPASGNGLYSYAGTLNTLYTREIKVWYPGEIDKNSPNRTEEVVVESRVSWNLGNISQSYFIRNNLLDW